MRIFSIIPTIFIFCIYMFTILSCNGSSTPTIPPPSNGDQPEPNNSPVSLFTVDPVQRAYKQGENVQFDGTSSFDPDQDALTYEWDFTYDDSTFLAGMTGPSLNYSLPSFGSVVAALRVTDSADTPLNDVSRLRLNVEPAGTLSNVTDGAFDEFMLRHAVVSQNDFYVLYTGINGTEEGVYVQRSSDLGETWGDPVLVSSEPDDRGPWGVWMDSAPFGIALGWMANNGDIKYIKGEPSGVNSLSFSSKTTVGTTGVVVEKGFVPKPPVVYSIACTPDGSYCFIDYMTSASGMLNLIIIELNSGDVVSFETIGVKTDSSDRYNFSGSALTASSQNRAYVTYIWKSLGYDNLDTVELYYVDAPSTTLQGPIRADSGLDGFIFNHDPGIILNSDNEPIVFFRTTGLYQGGKDVAICISEGDPPVFGTTIRGNNLSGDSSLVAQNSPAIIMDNDHSHLWVAFEDFRDNKNVSEIYLTMFDDQMSTLLPDFNISDDAAHIFSDINPRLVFNNGDSTSLMVLWERNSEDIVAYHSSY
ncbi:MAG: PKD domain-containing protein [bacterium]